MTGESEFAPEYSRAERLGLALAIALFGLLLFWLLRWQLLPWLDGLGVEAHCREYWGRSLLSWLLFAVFVGLPLSVALLAGVTLLPMAIRGLQSGQFPPPGQRVLRRTRIRRGTVARALSALPIVVVVALLGITVWGGQQPGRFVQSFSLGQQDCPRGEQRDESAAP